MILYVIHNQWMVDLSYNPELPLQLRGAVGKLVFVGGCQWLSLSLVSVIPLLILNEAIESRIYGILVRIYGIRACGNNIVKIKIAFI